MNNDIQQLMHRMSALRTELLHAVQEQEASWRASLDESANDVEQRLHQLQLKMKTHWLPWLASSRLRNVLSAPIIYSMIVPFLLLDVCVTLYQWTCFPLYRLTCVTRGDYIVIDHHLLPYLNVIEKINCVYCSYGNGVIAYAGEIAGRTEQYWCPIKHAKKMIAQHEHYHTFAEYGNSEAYLKKMNELRKE